MGTICGGVCGCRSHWDVPGDAARVLLATAVGHVLPTVSRTAKSLGLNVSTAPHLVDVVDPKGGRGIDRLFHRLARELTAAELELEITANTVSNTVAVSLAASIVVSVATTIGATVVAEGKESH